MKNLLLILALFVGNSFAEEEFPIQLTCEVGMDIIYLNIDKTRDKTWLKAHPSSLDRKDGEIIFFENKFQKKVKPKRTFFIVDDSFIRLQYSALSLVPITLSINRISGEINMGSTAVRQFSGQCFKGFKEYKQKKF